ncbi:hypothetical protein BH10ACI2_BH10ACI2_19240 [soil metagenome]
MNNLRSLLLTVWLIVLSLISTISLNAQAPPKPNATQEKPSAAAEEKEYQNRQRARQMLLMKGEIKALEDTAMRCLVRLEIVRFIYENDVRGEFDSADGIAVEYFEDIAANPDQIPEVNAGRWQNFILTMLRQKSPDLAKKVEKKYMAKVDSSVADLQELNESNTRQIADRTIAKIVSGDVSTYALTIHDKIRTTDPNSADRILAALLGNFEKTADASKFALLLDFIRENYVRPTTPVELKSRYLGFVVARARGQVSDADTGPTARFVLRMLKSALPFIQESLPNLYTEAQAMFVVLDARLNKNNRESEEAYARIEASDDKLRQVIAEAEATNDKDLKESFWDWAARLALEAKKFRMAVDLMMKVGPHDKAAAYNSNAFLIYHVIPQAIKGNDIEAAEYAIKNISSDDGKADGLFVIAKAYVDANDKQQAFEMLERALKLVEKGDADPDKVNAILVNLPTAIAIDKTKGFETASLAIKIANHLPTPTVDDKVGSASRQKYLGNVLMRVAWALIPAFKVLAKADPGFASATADEFRLKDWKLLAQAVVETERKYPMPQEQRKIN